MKIFFTLQLKLEAIDEAVKAGGDLAELPLALTCGKINKHCMALAK